MRCCSWSLRLLGGCQNQHEVETCEPGARSLLAWPSHKLGLILEEQRPRSTKHVGAVRNSIEGKMIGEWVVEELGERLGLGTQPCANLG